MKEAEVGYRDEIEKLKDQLNASKKEAKQLYQLYQTEKEAVQNLKQKAEEQSASGSDVIERVKA